MNLKKCPNHGYTLKANCPKCNLPTQDAHYKFIKIRNAVPNPDNKEDR